MAKITINTDLGKETISKHIYGHFSEHLGRCIYDGYWVGEDSPVANVRGIRTDIVEALKKIQTPNLRWPGGCFADEYHWKDGIGPREDRPTMLNTHWGKVTENNHFGTHEFMDLCEQLECEPYICGNLGSGTVQEMSQWVEYLTFDGVSPMADLRRRNGRDKPWKVKYWGVGNENWGCGGGMRPEYYADEYRRYQTYCRSYDYNQLYKIACGPHGDNTHWTEVMMRECCPGRMHGLALHYYAKLRLSNELRSATDFQEIGWFRMLKVALHMEELVCEHTTVMDRYDPGREVSLIVDEWGAWHAVEPGTNPGFLYQQNTLRDALVAGVTLNIFNNHCERIHMANIAQTINVLQAMILTEGEKMILTPTYHVFDMYKAHQEATFLPISLECDQYALKEEALPALNASASRSDDGSVNISICNIDPGRDREITVDLRGSGFKAVDGEIVTGPEINTHNTFDQPEQISVRPFAVKLNNNRLSAKIPGKSVVMLKVHPNAA